jgi:hypothetical protein
MPQPAFPSLCRFKLVAAKQRAEKPAVDSNSPGIFRPNNVLMASYRQQTLLTVLLSLHPIKLFWIDSGEQTLTVRNSISGEGKKGCCG